MKTQLIALGLAITILMPNVAMASNKKTTINPLHLTNSLQYGYSQATVVSAGSKLVHIAGQVGITDKGKNDFKSQVDRSFEALQKTLKASGASIDDVLKITLLIVDYDADKLEYMVTKRRAVFGDTPPASTLIPVPALYAPGVLFEIDAVAVAK